MAKLENQPPSCYNQTMSFFISLGIILLASLIIACLQLQPGIFALFSHYVSGKFSKSRSSSLSLFFILGVEIATACFFLCSFYIVNLLFLCQFRPEIGIFSWIMVGIFIALSIASLFFYFRPEPGTKLFIPRRCPNMVNQRIYDLKTRQDALVLGFFSGIFELPFTFPLYLITSFEVSEMSPEFYPTNLTYIIFILAPIVPLLLIKLRFKAGYNLADIQKSRVKNKNFTRIILSLSYLTIAILLIYFRINL